MLGCAQQEIEAHLRGVTREQHTTREIDAAKSQTHSATAVGFGFFSPIGSAVWRPHPSTRGSAATKRGGNCIIRAATRRRFAASQLLMLQIPHHSQPEVRRIAYKTWHSTGWREKTRPTPPLQQHFREKVRPALHKTPILGHFTCAGRTLSRSHPPSDQQGEEYRASGATTRRH